MWISQSYFITTVMTSVGYGEISDSISTLPSIGTSHNQERDLPTLIVIMLTGLILDIIVKGSLAIIISEMDDSLLEPEEYSSMLIDKL